MKLITTRDNTCRGERVISLPISLVPGSLSSPEKARIHLQRIIESALWIPALSGMMELAGNNMSGNRPKLN